MCGIIISKDINKIPLVKHRGIESSFVKRHGFYIGHHRLPIQTLVGDSYKQPIELDNGELLLYNGEIFNYPKGWNSDVEYLIDVFNNRETFEDVLQCANEWDGFWAIVHINSHGMIHCFTDPLGKKQLYYNAEGEICSEIRPLINDSKFDSFFKSSVYKWGYNTTHHTPWENVQRIIPGRVYTFYSGKLFQMSSHVYYDWGLFKPTECLEELLTTAVKNRLVSKLYKVGALVSGGLDSSIIAMILKYLNADVSYYSIENNESEYANMLAEHLGFDLKYLEYNVKDDIEEIFKWNETPIDLGSVIPQHKLFEVIPEKIVISGDGADELFGGYRRAKEYDSQMSDVFEELPYYHLPRLDRASMRFTIELRNPFLSHDVIKYALQLPYSERINKKHLKDIFREQLPDEIIDREKLPLKNEQLVQNSKGYKNLVFDLFYNKIFKI